MCSALWLAELWARWGLTPVFCLLMAYWSVRQQRASRRPLQSRYRSSSICLSCRSADASHSHACSRVLRAPQPHHITDPLPPRRPRGLNFNAILWNTKINILTFQRLGLACFSAASSSKDFVIGGIFPPPTSASYWANFLVLVVELLTCLWPAAGLTLLLKLFGCDRSPPASRVQVRVSQDTTHLCSQLMIKDRKCVASQRQSHNAKRATNQLCFIVDSIKSMKVHS